MQLIHQYFLANINPQGQCDGCVLASPSKAQPDYYYHWQRDGAISMGKLFDFLQISDPQARTRLEAYSKWVQRVQFGDAPNGIDVRGEPKFFVSGKTFNQGWMRPQNDGPCLRAVTLSQWALYLIAAGQRSYVVANLYNLDASKPGIKRDLEYVINNWQLPTGDPWEELRGPVFFAKIAARKAMLLGAQLAANMSDSGAAAQYLSVAKRIEADIDAVHWSQAKGLIMEIPNDRELDSAVHLGVLYGHMNDGFYDPSTPKVQSSVSKYVDAFSGDYFQINVKDTAAGIPGLLTGRYLRDTYNGGNSSQPGQGHAWILCTASLGEIFYQSAKMLNEQGTFSVSALNQRYFEQALELSAPLAPLAASQHRTEVAALLKSKSAFSVSRESKPAMFAAVVNSLALTGDALLQRIRYHVKDQAFHCTEQINKDVGTPQGAQDLTWSYGTVIGAMAVRKQLAEAGLLSF